MLTAITLMGTVGLYGRAGSSPAVPHRIAGRGEMADATVKQNASSLTGSFLNRFNICRL